MSQPNQTAPSTARRSQCGRAPRPRLPPGPLCAMSISDRWRRRYFIYGKRPSEKRKMSKTSSAVSDIGSSILTEAEFGSAAQQTVLSTPDLLIVILSQLPHSALLKAQLVCRTWASLFDNVEIQAALFLRPRPKGSAFYVEAYSDILMNHFSPFWPLDAGSDSATFPTESAPTCFHSKEFLQQRVHVSGKVPLATPEPPPEQQCEASSRCPHLQKWRQLLVCQPPVQALELVQQVSRRGAGLLELRTVIRRPDGLRMGFLFDAVRHWHQVERSNADVLWNRQTGDTASPEDSSDEYDDGPVSKMAEREPCLTLWGHSSVGCGQYGGLTYANYIADTHGTADTRIDQVIHSGDEKVEYSMSEVGKRR